MGAVSLGQGCLDSRLGCARDHRIPTRPDLSAGRYKDTFKREVEDSRRLGIVAEVRALPRRSPSRGLGLLIPLMGTVSAALALSACAKSHSFSLLTSANMPSYLGVAANPSVTINYAGRLTAAHGCKMIGVAVLSMPGKPVDAAVLPASAEFPVVTEVLATCTSKPPIGAHGAVPVSGIGNMAVWAYRGTAGGGRLYSILWAKGNQYGTVTVAGPTGDDRIGPGLAELLAHRAATQS